MALRLSKIALVPVETSTLTLAACFCRSLMTKQRTGIALLPMDMLLALEIRMWIQTVGISDMMVVLPMRQTNQCLGHSGVVGWVSLQIQSFHRRETDLALACYWWHLQPQLFY